MRSILCYGDSNTWGAATVARPDNRYAPNERWPGVLRAALGPEWLVIEEGLGGRTTVSDDPVEWNPDKNGARFLPVCLHSHKPLDVVAIMLGTNDLKARFGKTPWEVAQGVGVLVDLVKMAGAGRNGGTPEIIVMCPMGSRHSGHINRLTSMLVKALDPRCVVAVQVPVRAILGIYARETGQGMIFPEGDADPDPTDGPPAAPAAGKDTAAKSKRPKLQVVK